MTRCLRLLSARIDIVRVCIGKQQKNNQVFCFNSLFIGWVRGSEHGGGIGPSRRYQIVIAVKVVLCEASKRTTGALAFSKTFSDKVKFVSPKMHRKIVLI